MHGSFGMYITADSQRSFADFGRRIGVRLNDDQIFQECSVDFFLLLVLLLLVEYFIG